MLTALGGRQASAQDNQKFGPQVATAIQEGRFAEAEQSIQTRLAAFPADVDAHYLAAILYLRARQPEAARPHFQALSNLAGSDLRARSLAAKIEAVMPPPPLREEQIHQLEAELNRYRADAASKVVDQLPVSAAQREIIKLYLDIYQARFVSALSRLQRLSAAASVPADDAQALRAEIGDMTKEYSALSGRLDEFLNSALANGYCTPESARKAVQTQNLLLEDYVRVASNAVSAFPLNSRFLDLGFHAMLLAAPYDDLERYGDLVLQAKGNIRIPFFGRSQLFFLVIDEKGQRLYTEPNTAVSGNPAAIDAIAEYVPFDLPFAQITALHQRANADIATQGLAAGSYAIALDPLGKAPAYAFMPLVHCLYGEDSQKQSTANLGRFIRHVARDALIRTELVDPSKLTHDRFGTFVNSLAIVSMAAQQAAIFSGGVNVSSLRMADGSFRQGMSVLQTSARERIRIRTIQAGQEQAQEVWQHALSSRIVNALSASAVVSRFPQLDAFLVELRQGK